MPHRTAHKSGGTPLCALAAAVALLAGCKSAPTNLDNAELETDRAVYQKSDDYWRRDSLPPLHGYDGVAPQHALIEFAVEFVQEKIETPFKSQVIAVPPSLFGIAAETIGFGKKQVEFSVADRERLAALAYRIFVDEMTRRGVTLVPQRLVQDAPAMENFSFAQKDSSSLLLKINFFASDTGRTREVRVVPAPGFGVITDAVGGNIVAVEQQVREQLGVERVIRTRLRMGVFRGYASFEAGSSVWVVGRDYEGILTAQRSLLSTDPVVEADFALLRGDVYRVDGDAYAKAMEKTLPTFFGLAAEAAGGKPLDR
jgi:hypothetical protein